MDGNTRRLPPWMLTGASSDAPVLPEEVKRKHEPEEKGPKAKAEKRPRRKPKGRDDSEESKKVGIKRSKIVEEEAKPRICVGKNQEIIQSVTAPKDEEDLTVDDLLSFAQEYRTIKDGQGLSESTVVVDESNTTKEPNQTRDPTAQDMLSLLLGPYFKKRDNNSNME